MYDMTKVLVCLFNSDVFCDVTLCTDLCLNQITMALVHKICRLSKSGCVPNRSIKML